MRSWCLLLLLAKILTGVDKGLGLAGSGSGLVGDELTTTEQKKSAWRVRGKERCKQAEKRRIRGRGETSDKRRGEEERRRQKRG